MRTISGSRIIADFPLFKLSRTISIYISVFPLLVTPCKRKGENEFEAEVDFICCKTYFCSFVNLIFFFIGETVYESRSGSLSFSFQYISSFFNNSLHTEDGFDVRCLSELKRTGLLCSLI